MADVIVVAKQMIEVSLRASERQAQDHGPRGALLQCFTPVAFHTILSEL